MEKEIFNHNSQLMYCPNCSAVISRTAIECPKCRQRIHRPSRWPMVWVVIAGILSALLIAGVLTAIAVPAYNDYIERAEAAQLELEQSATDHEHGSQLQCNKPQDTE